MSNHVATYRRLEDNATRAETQAEEWRWEQCREAFEAVDSGEYTLRSFADAVGKSHSHIKRQSKAWANHGTTSFQDRPTYTEAMAEVGGWSTGAEKTRDIAIKGARNLSTPEKARLAAELLEDEEVAEEVEEMQLSRRGPIGEPLPDPEAAGRRVGNKMARQMETDLATGALRSAAGALAEAVLCKEQFGVKHPDQEAEALDRIDRYLSAYKAGGHVSDDDRSWLESIGVDL
jgi:hypothetical protein